jgi:5-deoxy-glucuronate isomerase
MHGAIRGTVGGVAFEFCRASLFDESASVLHAPAGARYSIEAATGAELTVYRCANGRPFAPRAFGPADVPNEHRGAGQVRDRCLRFVRTVFDRRNSPDSVELVLGEVVTLPGGWSSYPPHHHAQPEIYHYRFSEPQGYGHAELGDEVVKVRHNDTIRIPAGHDHAQCAAPGYGMYYSWVIRHLPGNPYTVPEFNAEHAWTMARDAHFWWPRELDDDGV